MGLYLRIFARKEDGPDPEQIRAWFSEQHSGVQPVFAVDADGWARAEWKLGQGGTLTLERFLSSEKGLRAELNTWAAYLETCDYSPHHLSLMERTIQTHQLFILRRPLDHADEVYLDRHCESLARFLAMQADGFYHIDDRGFFEADGTLLVQEY